MIETSDTHKTYGQFGVVKGVDLRVDKGEVLSIIGGFGPDKSTLLTRTNGLEPIQRGSIRADGIDVHARGTGLNRLQRRIGTVSQQWNAFPHLTMLENVMLAPHKVLGKSRAETEAVALRQLTHVGLGDKLKVFPQHLPGGQQQHMAIARALAMPPDYILFDEAISVLDPQLVDEMLDTTRLLTEEGMTTVLVTRKIRLARDASDRMAFFRNGLAHKIGTPDQVIGDPQRPETVEFLHSVL